MPAAGIIFGGGFPRGDTLGLRRAAQHAIFYVQRELEESAETDNPAVVLCDRGTVDSAAYWPGPDELWSSVGMTLEKQLLRYDAVIHLRTPPPERGYNHQNLLRTESAAAAAEIDERLLRAWAQHPRRFIIGPSQNFLEKASRALHILRGEMPECCRHRAVPATGGGKSAVSGK